MRLVQKRKKHKSWRFDDFRPGSKFGAEDAVPEAAGDAEAIFIIFVVVIEMIGF